MHAYMLYIGIQKGLRCPKGIEFIVAHMQHPSPSHGTGLPAWRPMNANTQADLIELKNPPCEFERQYIVKAKSF